jgi:hypothetical protein
MEADGLLSYSQGASLASIPNLTQIHQSLLHIKRRFTPRRVSSHLRATYRLHLKDEREINNLKGMRCCLVNATPHLREASDDHGNWTVNL